MGNAISEALVTLRSGTGKIDTLKAMMAADLIERLAKECERRRQQNHFLETTLQGLTEDFGNDYRLR